MTIIFQPFWGEKNFKIKKKKIWKVLVFFFFFAKCVPRKAGTKKKSHFSSIFFSIKQIFLKEIPYETQPPFLRISVNDFGNA